MVIIDRIREMSVLPSRFNIMLEQALCAIKDDSEREDLWRGCLCRFECCVAVLAGVEAPGRQPPGA